MKRVSRSILIFGIYSIVVGLVLLFIPNIILPVFGIQVSSEPWLHLLGFVLMCSSYYYIRAAQKGNIDFARYTVHTRFAAPLVVAFLVLSGKADFNFIGFGVIDGLGGLWTWLELRGEKKSVIT